MASEVRILYDRLRRTAFPGLGKQVGDSPLHDSLIAGCASRASRGEPLDAEEVPVPDDETAMFVMALRQKEVSSEEEQAFLSYFDLLEQLRASLQRQDARWGIHRNRE